MENEENPTYYAIIPANVRYDNDLTDREKLLYGEITALTQKTCECWASNEYFANLYGISIRSLQRSISNLVKKKYINKKLIYKKDKKEVEKRILTLVTDLTGGWCQNLPHPGDKNVMDNNTSINNININNKEKEIYKEKETSSEPLEEEIRRFKKPSIEEVKEYCEANNYQIDAERFFDYYESKGWFVGKSKMKDWKAAIRTWVRNNFESDKRTFGSFPISSVKSVNFSPKDVLGDKPEFPDYMKKPGSERCKDIPDLIKEGLYEEYVKISDSIDEWNRKSDKLREQRRRY